MKIYLAGPDVFLPDAVAIGQRKREICLRHGVTGLYPLANTVDLAAPAAQPVELFVEGPTPQWALPIPKPSQGSQAGRAQFRFELDGLPPGVNPSSPIDLIFTVVTGDRAVEVKTHLD